jgi:hypothetical protein
MAFAVSAGAERISSMASISLSRPASAAWNALTKPERWLSQASCSSAYVPSNSQFPSL